MSLWSEEKEARAEKDRLGRRRANALRNKNLTLAARLGRRMRKVAQRILNLRAQRIYGFKPSMLDGHPGNVTDAVKRNIADAHAWADRRGTTCYITSTTDGVHSTNSFHYAVLINKRKKGRAADINFNTEGEEIEYQNYLRGKYGLEDFYELLGPANWAQYTSGFTGGPAPGHYGSNAHVHSAPKSRFRHE